MKDNTMSRVNRYALVAMLMGLAILTISCEKLFEWNYTDVHEDIPVVESIITNELKHQKVILSLVRAHPNQPSRPLSGAQVRVLIGPNVYDFAELADQPGSYVSLHEFIGVSGIDIRLKVDWNNTEYEAVDNMPPISPTNRGVFLPVGNDTSLYYLVESGSVFFTNEPAMWEFQISWEFLPHYAGHHPDSCKATLYYYNLKIIDQGQIFAPPQQKNYFPKGALVYQTKYSLSDEHKKFRRSLLLETQWRGGLMDVSPGSVYTNVSNGGLGFFGACSVLRDTFYIQ